MDTPLRVHENVILDDVDDVHVKMTVELTATSLSCGWVVISVLMYTINNKYDYNKLT